MCPRRLASTPQIGNNSDRDYFIYHHNNKQTGTLISAPIRSRSTGHWIIPVSRRLEHGDGSFAGVALATLRLDSFERVYASLDLGTSGTVFFALENGTLIYRRPFQEKLIGTDLSHGAVFASYRRTGRAGTEMLVAAAMADYTLGQPINGVVEIAGPEKTRLSDLVQHYLTFKRDPRKVVANPDTRRRWRASRSRRRQS